jgi:hypothetical protein
MLTPDTLTPSADVARAVAAPKMRFFYPLAAFCVAAVLLTPSGGQAQTPLKLRPDQQRAVEFELQDVDPSVRGAARIQLERTLVNFSEAQIAKMVARWQRG